MINGESGEDLHSGFKRNMAQTNEGKPGTSFTGVSLPSFLQMLEQERKSCTLVVSSGERTGSFYFEDGDLIDAVYQDQLGLEAAHSILLWDHPSFTVGMPDDRMRRIELPLAHILLDSAKRMDEEKDDVEESQRDWKGFQQDDSVIQSNPTLRQLIQTITEIPNIRHYYFLDRQGKLIIQSSRKQNLGDFITFCIVSGIQMRKILDAKGPNRIHLKLESGDVLLIVPGAGMIIGLLLEEHASVDEVTEKLRPALARKEG